MKEIARQNDLALENVLEEKERMQEQVDALALTLDNRKDEIDQYCEDRTALQEDIGQLQEALRKAKERISESQEQLKNQGESGRTSQNSQFTTRIGPTSK